MITWMQKHRKYMLITMWVAVITFIGAGAVDWGSASYGSKATSVAKVGDVEISQSEFQKQYSLLYRQYNEMLGGKLDENLARQFGIEGQALNGLVNKALLLNLARDYDFLVTDEDVAHEIQKMASFLQDGVFNKEVYKKLLQNNGYSIKEFEDAVKKDITVNRLSSYLSTKSIQEELKPAQTIAAIHDNIEYKILNSDALKVAIDEAALEAFWETQKTNFLTPATFTVEKIVTQPVTASPSAEEISAFYEQNSFKFLDEKGAILSQEAAMPDILLALNDKATKLAANRLYIEWKKGELASDITIKKETFSSDGAPYTQEIMQQLETLPLDSAPLKAVKVGNTYVVLKLVNRNERSVKTFQQAKSEVLPLFTAEQKRLALQAAVEKELPKFKGKTTGFINQNQIDAINELTPEESKTVLTELFTTQEVRGSIVVSDQKVMLYHIKEQKLLFKENAKNTDLTLEETVTRLKEQSRMIALMETLNKKYTTQNYLK